MSDTIVALATPVGRSGIGVIRLSGSDSLSVTHKLIGGRSFPPIPQHATLRKLVDPETDEASDEAVITYFKGPNSFTGEDVVEISCHGSTVVLRQVLDWCLSLGARLAGRGEFSLRAVANGRIDLSEAEAIRDLINAQTVAAARQSFRQMKGEFSHQLQPLKDELLNVIVVLESAIEFVEDDLPETQVSSLAAKLEHIEASIAELASTFKAGRLIRDGIRVALVGRPNVGKSSLFNALLGSDRAIVTDIAGTTRDQLHERLTINDIPISLIDTAGLRDTDDAIESIGVERSKRTMADVDLVLVLLDSTEPLSVEDVSIIKSVKQLLHLVVLNKIDTLNVNEIELRTDEVKVQLRSMFQDYEPRALAISARTGEGLHELKQALVSPFSLDEAAGAGFLVSDARHHDLLVRAAHELGTSISLLKEQASEEIILVGLHNAMRFLGEITGETTTEDMLTRIFSTFCIGK